MQSFNLEVVPTVEDRLVDFGDSREEWTGYLRQRVEVAAIDASEGDPNQLRHCDGQEQRPNVLA